MIYDSIEDVAKQVYKPIQDIAEEMRERDRKRARAYIGGGLIFAISMLAMKCDNTINHGEALDKIQETRNAIEKLEQDSFRIYDPCIDDNEVRAC